MVVCAKSAFGSWNTSSAARFLCFPDRVAFACPTDFCFFCLARVLPFPDPVCQSLALISALVSRARLNAAPGFLPAGCPLVYSVAVGTLPAMRFDASDLPSSLAESDSLSDSYCQPLRGLTLVGTEFSSNWPRRPISFGVGNFGISSAVRFFGAVVFLMAIQDFYHSSFLYARSPRLFLC